MLKQTIRLLCFACLAAATSDAADEPLHRLTIANHACENQLTKVTIL
jgi:hypothetical protein